MKYRDRFNRKYMQISLYVIMTAIIIYILSLIAKNAPSILTVIMEKVNWLLKVIRPVILGFVFAYLLDPVVNFFEGKFRKLKIFKKMKRHRIWATLLSVIIFFLALVGLVSLLIFTVTDQIRLANFDDIIALATEYIKSIEAFYNSILNNMEKLDIQSSQLEQYIENILTVLLNAVRGFADNVVNSITNISGYFTTIIFGFIIGFYFIIDGKIFTLYLKKVSYALFSKKTNKRISTILSDMNYAFSGYVRGQLADAFVMMILISLVLSITQVKFAIVIGIFAGLGNLIPYFGPIVAYFLTSIVCLINGEFQKLIISIIALIIVQTIDGNFIGPKLLSRSIKIHPLIIIVSLIFGNAIGGFLGMLLAVPVGAYIKLVFVRYIDNRNKKKKELEKADKKKDTYI